MNVLYVEHHGEGYAKDWLQLLIPTLLMADEVHNVHILCHYKLNTLAKSFSSSKLGTVHTLLDDFSGSDDFLQKSMVLVNEIKALKLSLKFDVCVVPWLDILLASELKQNADFNFPVVGICFRPPRSLVSSNVLKNGVRRIQEVLYSPPRLRTDKSNKARWFIGTLDERAEGRLDPYTHQPMTYCPDPAPCRGALTTSGRNRVDGSRKLFLVFGHLIKRKGIHKLIEAAHHLSPEHQRETTIRVVGHASSIEYQTILKSAISKVRAQTQCIIEYEEKFLTQEELAQEISLADAIVLPYQNHLQSSGVVLWAAAMRRPVIAPRVGWLGYVVKRYKLGKCVNTSNPKEIAASIQNPLTTTVSDLDAFYEKHTPSLFTSSLLDLMRRADTCPCRTHPRNKP